MRRRAPRLPERRLPVLPLATLEPCFVAFTLVSGALATLGLLLENVPLLVLTCWFLFLAREDRPGRAASSWRRYAPAVASGCAGVAVAILPILPLGPREGALALFSAGLAFVLLPRGAGKGEPLAWSLRGEA